MKKMRVIDCNSYNDIFTKLKTKYNPSYLENVDTSILDFDFLMNYGRREIPCLLESKTSDDIVTIIYNRFNEQWNRAYDVLFSQYNPIENYNMDEHVYETGEIKNTNDGESSSNNKQEVISGIYGFNSVGSTDSDNTSSNAQGSSNSKNTSKTSFDNRDTHTTRSGNIGVTTTQQMIESELKIRSIDLIRGYFDSISKILTIESYM